MSFVLQFMGPERPHPPTKSSMAQSGPFVGLCRAFLGRVLFPEWPRARALKFDHGLWHLVVPDMPARINLVSVFVLHGHRPTLSTERFSICLPVASAWTCGVENAEERNLWRGLEPTR